MLPADAQLLTRTTLQVDQSTAGASLADLVRALHRVPGVLFAEANAADACVVVAHDAAVPANSLVAASAALGIPANIITDTRPPLLVEKPGWQLQVLRNRRLMIAAAVALILLTLVDVLVPDNAHKHWLLIALTTSLWVFFIAKSIVASR